MSNKISFQILLCIEILGIVVLSGCDEYDLPNDVKWASEHFVYHTRSDEEQSCQAITDTLERHYEVISEYFQLPADAESFHYYKFLDFDDFNQVQPCPKNSGACANTATHKLFTHQVMHRHELIHLYFSSLGGDTGT